MHPILGHFRNLVPPIILRLVDDVWIERHHFIRWPQREFLFIPGAIRERYRVYTPTELAQIRAIGRSPDTRSNGPAIMAFLLAEGERPFRSIANRGWNIHHIYDGKFPAPSGETPSLHAVKHGDHFTEAAGLVAIHPIAEAMADEIAYFSWLLRFEAFHRFGYDPDCVFRSMNACN